MGFTLPQGRFRRVVRAPDTFSTVLCSACLLWVCMTLLTAPAQALERVVPDNPSAVASTDGKTASAYPDDSCLALLKTNYSREETSPAYAPEPTAGKTAVIGFVFGLRFALGPSQTTKGGRTSVAFWHPGNSGNSQAMAIADYRRCRNEAALKEQNR